MVLSEVERTGPTDSDGGPARVAQTWWAAADGAWPTDRRGESADFPANRRRRTCRGQYNGGVQLKVGPVWHVPSARRAVVKAQMEMTGRTRTLTFRGPSFKPS